MSITCIACLRHWIKGSKSRNLKEKTHDIIKIIEKGKRKQACEGYYEPDADGDSGILAPHGVLYVKLKNWKIRRGISEISATLKNGGIKEEKVKSV